MTALETSKFVRPYAQEALGGKDGLTSSDIAKALGWSVKHVNRNLGVRDYASSLRGVGCLVEEVTVPSGTTAKRQTKVWILDTDAAKIFVAQTRTPIGLGYVKYLLQCERVAEQEIPKLKAAIKKMAAQIEALSQPRQVRSGRSKMWELVKGIRVTVNLFGEEITEIVRERKALSEMDKAESRAYHIQHLSKIAEGAARTVKELATFEKEPPKRRLKAVPSLT